MEYRTGCSGWSYKGWVGPFYPKGTDSSEFLELYSRVFNTVEIDSTFYASPDSISVRKWRESTPDDFQFTAKMPRVITHERRLVNVEIRVGYFLESIKSLKEKLGMVLVQFPHSFTQNDGFEDFRKFLKLLPQDLQFAVEFRHNSWFNDEVYSLMKEENITLAWSEIPMAAPPDELTSSSAYLRLVGDRSINEKDFGTVQKDRSDIIRKWAEKLEKRRDVIDHTFVFSNNHFQGFGPATVNSFRQAVGLEPVDWLPLMNDNASGKQRTLFDW